MATLTIDEIADDVIASQRELGRGRLTEIATDIQDHVAFNQLMRQSRIQTSTTGRGWQWQVMVQQSGAARHVGLFEVDSVNVGDVLKQANVPPRFANSNYAIDLREQLMNAGPAEIVDIVKTRRMDAMISFAELLDADFWESPSASSDDKKPWGTPYWFPYDSAVGFNGGDNAAFANGPADIDSDTYSRWKYYSGQYTNVTKPDLIRKMRKAATFVGFRTPMGANIIPSYNTGDNFGYYTNYNVIGVMEELLESQNDNLGRDIASMDGRIMFRGNPVVWVPRLEGRAGDPVYGLNWGVMKLGVIPGWFMREFPLVRKEETQHTVMQGHIDTHCNFLCRNRRKNFMLATGDPGNS